MTSRASELIRVLDLRPHPEGGHFREVFRSARMVQPGDGRPPRAAVTTICFLLAEGEHSCWHRVLSDEVWHFFEGAPLELVTASPDCDRVERVALGTALGTSVPVHVVPAGWWQAARPRGAYTLAGCTVAPGFEFEDFTFLRERTDLAARVTALDPALGALL